MGLLMVPGTYEGEPGVVDDQSTLQVGGSGVPKDVYGSSFSICVSPPPLLQHSPSQSGGVSPQHGLLCNCCCLPSSCVQQSSPLGYFQFPQCIKLTAM